MNRLIISASSPLTKHFLSRIVLPTASTSSTIITPLSSSSPSSSIRSFSSEANKWHGTTILCVRKNNQVCMIGDGMVSMGNVTIKPNAKKIRRLYPKTVGGRRHSSANKNDNNDKAEEGEEDQDESTIVGFAGSTADAFTLLERLEGKLDEYPGQLTRSCVELAKGWRTDKYLRRLEASLIVADESVSLEITGNGDVLEPHDGVLAVGSGGFYAQAAARALTYNVPDMSAEEVARKAMDIASDMCVYTNKEYVVETITIKEDEGKDGEEEEEGKSEK